jgi:hypothetical protein
MRHTPSPRSLDLPLAGQDRVVSEQLPALESRLQELHSYQTPEFLVLGIEAGSHSYLKWLHACLNAPQGTKV